MGAGRYFEDVKVGEMLPPFVRTTVLETWNRYAAVNDEFVDVHMDPDLARKRGDKDVLGMGNLRLSYLHNLLRSWAGDEGEIRRVTCQHRGINYRNDTLTCSGKVTGTRLVDGASLVDLELSVTNQAGEVIDVGEATVALPKKAG